MAIVVNTNMQALKIQQNLNSATDKMNQAMERMSSGSRINSAKDDAAGYAVSTKLELIISGSQVASDNTAIGVDLLSTTEGILDVIEENLQRIRDLTIQAANGVYTKEDIEAMCAEASARFHQIETLADNTSFNGKKLLDGTCSDGITLQIGTTSTDSLLLNGDIFDSLDLSVLIASFEAPIPDEITPAVRAAMAGFLDTVDSVIEDVTGRVTDIGAAVNQLEAVSDGLEVQETNLTSALSTIQDSDVAEESAKYVQSQILQSASATLLVQANAAPQIALTLIQR